MRLIGHRGARGEAPENTLSGFRYLRRLGVHAVELDIQVSADGELVVIHDASLERCTNGTGRVADATSGTLATLDACHKAFPAWPDGDGVPTLRAVMEVIHDFEQVQFEVKAASENDARLVARKFTALWEEFGFGARGITTSFNPLYLQLVRDEAPHIPRGFLFEKDFRWDPVAMARDLGCVALGPHQERCTALLVQEAHAAGLQVSTWTVNTPERMRELAGIGTDSLISDVPSLARQEAGALFS
jgi:glycerophosphoryl diester phosphodiesterase